MSLPGLQSFNNAISILRKIAMKGILSIIIIITNNKITNVTFLLLFIIQFHKFR